MIGRLLLAAIFAVTLAQAQDEGAGAGGGGGGGRGGGMGDMGGMGGGMPRVQRQSKLQIFAGKLSINREQSAEVDKALTAGVQEALPIRQKIDSERVNIINAMLAGKPANMEAYSGLMSEMLAIEAKAFGQILASLKPNQTKKAGQHFELLSETFEATPMGGRGGMGRGGMRGGGGR